MRYTILGIAFVIFAWAPFAFWLGWIAHRKKEAKHRAKHLHISEEQIRARLARAYDEHNVIQLKEGKR